MVALLKSKEKPLLVQLPTGALVPLSGMASATPAAPIGAQMDDSGALVDALVQSAGSGSGNVAPGAGQADPMPALGTSSHGGAAHGALIGDQSQGAPLKQPPVLSDMASGNDPTGGSGAGLSTILKLAQAAGKGGGGDAAPASGPSDSTGGGLMGMLRDMFHGSDTKTPGTGIDPDFANKVAMRDNPTPTPANINEPALGLPDDAPITPTPRPPQVGDPPEPREVVAGAMPDAPPMSDVDRATAIAKGTALPQQEPGFLDKLRENPLALALITGGLQTMSAASRPGATALGSLGEGALGGLKGAFEMQASDRQRELENRRQDTADAREASENVLRGKQGAFYDARTTDVPLKTAIAGKTADARSKTADAAMVRADAYSKKTNDPKSAGASVFQQKQQAWLAVPGHENDLQGALDYAAGHKTMAGADKYLAARRLATSQMNGMVSAPDDPNWLDNTTSQILTQMDANDASHGNGNPGSKGGGPALGGGKGGGKGGPALGGPAKVSSAADVAKLPKGAPFINPSDGRTLYKK